VPAVADLTPKDIVDDFFKLFCNKYLFYGLPGIGPEVVNLFNYYSAKNTYSMVCLGLEPAVADLTPKDIMDDVFLKF
jgi:hypothetical protein